MPSDKLESQNNFAPILAAAERLLSNVLGSQVRLGEVAPLTEKGRRNVVLRCHDLSSGAPSSFIIKQVAIENYDPRDTTSWDVRRFFSDWVGAEFLSTIPSVPRCSPRFFAGDRASGFFILEDLGPHRSLVKPLLEEDAASAAVALLAFATCLGQLHAATRRHSARFERLCHDLSPETGLVTWAGAEFHERIKLLQAGLEQLAVRSEAAFLEELETVSGAIERPGPFFTYIHGDPCPDNVFLSGDQVRLIDFEFGRFGHALIDASYGRMMFPTCWCANRLPQGLISRMESAYRAELVKGCPEAADDSAFEAALVEVCAFWLLNTLGWQLQGALREDRTWGIATVRSRLLSRLETFVTIAGERRQLPAVRGVAERLLEVLRERWREAPLLPHYPAFERGELGAI
jgi:thiamine kinase-like enzyme